MSRSVPASDGNGLYFTDNWNPSNTGAVFCWIKRTAWSTFGFITGYRDTPSGGVQAGIFEGAAAENARTGAWGGSNNEFTDAGIANDTWQTTIVNARSSAATQLYTPTLNTTFGAAGDAVTGGATGEFCVSETSSGAGNPMAFLIAHVAFFSDELTAQDIADLQGGANPLALSVQPYAYWPMTDSSLDDSVNGWTFTEKGSVPFNADNPVVDAPPVGFQILSVGGDDQYYPGETNVALELDSAVTLASCTLDDGVTTPVDQPLTGGAGTANQTFNSVQGDNPYTRDHNGAQLGTRPQLTFTASDT